MNKNILPIVLIILAIGTYFTYTKDKMIAAGEIKAVNDNYKSAIDNAKKLIAVRDKVLKDYNNISEDDRERLDKMLPDNIDNIRLIIDMNGIATRHGLTVKNIRTTAGSESAKTASGLQSTSAQFGSSGYNTMNVSFGVSATYNNFISFIQDVERSLRILDISKITLNVGEGGVYDYNVEMKTYWLK